MSSINFNTLQDTSTNEDNYSYVDFYLDFSEDPTGSAANFRSTIGNGRDIRVAYDLNAIRNSIRNLFNTIPGERFLLPEYGSDLRRYIFEPVTETVSRQIGREVSDAIRKWEPRIRLLNIDIAGYEDRNEYVITLNVAIPLLNEPVGLEGLLTKDGYIF